MKRFIFALLAMVTMALASALDYTPDFAYPETVATDAAVLLTKAKTGADRLEALMLLTYADDAKDNASLKASADRLLQYEAKEKDRETRSMMNLFVADIYNKIYSRERYKFNQRDFVAGARPMDVSEWSTPMFGFVVDSLVNRAWELSAPDMKIDEFKKLTTLTNVSITIYPRVRDFIAAFADSKLSQYKKYYAQSAETNSRLRTEVLDGLTEGTAPFIARQLKNLDMSDVENSVVEIFKIYDSAISEYAKAYAASQIITLKRSYPAIEIKSATKALWSERYPAMLSECVKYETPFKMNIQDELNVINQDFVRIENLSTYIQANAPTKLKIEYKGVSKVEMKCYKFDSAEKWRSVGTNQLNKLTADKRFTFNLTNDGETHEEEFDFQLPYGLWQIMIKADDDDSYYDKHRQLVSCSVLPVDIKIGDDHSLLVVNPVTGEPQSGLPVYFIKDSIKKLAGKTDSKGLVPYIDPNKDSQSQRAYIEIEADGHAQQFAEPYITDSYNAVTQVNVDEVSLSTSLRLYHPGDTVDVVGVVTNGKMVVAGRAVSLRCLDMANKTLGEVKCVSDEMGRVVARFAIPDDVKTGNYFRVKAVDISGLVSFAVSDFKMPEFEIKSIKAYNAMPEVGQATIRGAIANFAGVAMSDVDVVLVGTRSETRYEARTDAAGNFELVLPREAFDMTDKDGECRENFAVTATSKSGYTVNSSVTAGCKYANTLKLKNKPEAVDVSKLVEMEIEYVDADGTQLDEELTWTLTNKSDSIIAGGAVSSTSLVADWSEIEPGSYTLRISPRSKHAAQYSTALKIYNRNIARYPCDIFWLPEKNVTAKNGVAKFDIFVAGDGQYINVIDGTKENIKKGFSTRYFKGGWNTLEFKISGDEKTANVKLLSVSALKNCLASLNIANEVKDMDKLNVVIESFRPEITTSATEKWSIKVTDANGKGTQSAVYLNVFNKQLDKILKYSPLYIKFKNNITAKSFEMSTVRFSNLNWGYKRTLPNLLKESITPPSWNTFGYEPRETVLATMGNPRKMMLASNSTATVDAVVEDAGAELTSSETDAVAEDNTEDIAWRDPEVMSALWLPILDTDKTGEAVVSFAAPNFNSTWRIEAAAWTNDGKKGSLSDEIITSKPVMVDSNLPRFLRHGDRAVIKSAVYNNSTEARNVEIVAEVRAGGQLVGENHMMVRLESHCDTIIETSIDVPYADELEYSVRAISGQYSDGERGVIALASSDSHVTEADNFYLNPEDTTYSAEIPTPHDRDFDCRLTFTANPMATVIEALPAVLEYDFPTSTVQSARYYMASIALSLMAKHPELATKFNKKELENVLKQSLKKLAELQTSDGGFKWAQCSQGASPWATANSLLSFGWLKYNGYLNDDKTLTQMIEKSLKYLDSHTERVDAVYYTLARSFFDQEPYTIEAKSLRSKIIQSILSNWKKEQPEYKALDAIILHLNKNEAMARTILGSVSQYATQTKDHGLQFKNVDNLVDYGQILEAYGLILPTSKEVDGLRQHLIIRKQAADWGAYPITSKVISSMVNSGTPWAGSADDVKISVDGRAINDIKVSGNACVIDSVKLVGQQVVIERSAKTPAYGAIITSYTAPSATITAYSDGEVSIEKSLLVKRQDGWTAVSADMPLKIGEKVKAQLTVKTTRPMSYLTIVDERPAGIEPVAQLSGVIFQDGAIAYREQRDRTTNLYIDTLPTGTFIFTSEYNCAHAGTFTSGVATILSDQAPSLTAHTSSTPLLIHE